MPKKAISAQERMNRELLAALRGGQTRMNEKNTDTARYLPKCQRVFYRRINAPELFTVEELRILAQRYHFTDYQVCQIMGVEYHGSTPA